MAAVVLSMILSVIGLAGYKLYEHELPVEHATKRIVHAFSLARAYAIAKNTTCAVRIDLIHHIFWVDETDAFGTTIVPKITTPEGIDPRVQLDAFSGMRRFGTPSLNIIYALFNHDGSSTNARLYFKLAGDKSDPANYFTIKLYGPTGQAKVFARQRVP